MILDMVYKIDALEEYERLRAYARELGDVTVGAPIGGAAYVYLPGGTDRLAQLAEKGFVLVSMDEWVAAMQTSKAPPAPTPGPAPSAPPPSTTASLGFVGGAVRVVSLAAPKGPPVEQARPAIPDRDVLERHLEALPQTSPTLNQGVLSIPLGSYRWMREADGFYVAWHPTLSSANKSVGETLGPFNGPKHTGWQALIAAVTKHAWDKSGYSRGATDAPESGTPSATSTSALAAPEVPAPTGAVDSDSDSDSGLAEYDDTDDAS